MDSECSICLLEMSGEGSIQGAALKCGHTYHPECILLWMKQMMSTGCASWFSPMCPACMHPIAGGRCAFAEPFDILEQTAEVKALAADVDAAFDRLPKREQDRALRGLREDLQTLMDQQALGAIVTVLTVLMIALCPNPDTWTFWIAIIILLSFGGREPGVIPLDALLGATFMITSLLVAHFVCSG